MSKDTAIKIFEQKQVRSVWNEEEEKWYFSIVDIIVILTDQIDFQKARKYWNKLKERLLAEGNETVTNSHQLKWKRQMAKDERFRIRIQKNF